MHLSPSTLETASISQKSPSHNAMQRILVELRRPITTLEDLEALLLPILSVLDAVPHGFDTKTAHTGLRRDDVLCAIPALQHVVLSAILPIWLVPLREAGHEPLPKAFFCPPSLSKGTSDSKPEVGCNIANSALSTLIAYISTLDTNSPGPAAVLGFCISTLSDIMSLYTVDRIHRAIYACDEENMGHAYDMDAQKWEDYVRNICALPGKVANVVQGSDSIIVSENMEHEFHFSSVCASAEKILFQISQRPLTEILIQSLSHLVQKLIHLGLFPGSPPALPTQPSFFATTLPTIRRRLQLASLSTASSNSSSAYSEAWTSVVKSLPLTSQQMFLTSLLGAFDLKIGRDTSISARRQVGSAARVLSGVVGALGGTDNDELWSAVSVTVCGSRRIWDIGVVRAVVAWIADPHGLSVDEAALKKLLDKEVVVWTNTEHVKRSLLSQHRYLTSLFLITIAAFPSTSETVKQLALFPPFISSISAYLSHLDSAVRRCGMLSAEIIAGRCGQKLAFGGWDDSGDELDWARAMRGWNNDWILEGFTSEDDTEGLANIDIDATHPVLVLSASQPPTSPHKGRSRAPAPPDSDDDSLSGYSSSGRSSRTSSPTPSELAEIEQDPSLRVGRTKPVPKPVYLAQLAALLKNDKNDDKDVAERTEVALNFSEQLIRRKKGFGFELDENAVELTISLLTLRDNYELDGFNEKRQGAITALIECCPRKASPTLVEQIFTNQYSTSDRIMMLTSLAIGARVLAGLSVPPTPSRTHPSIAFPSKMLTPALHQRYATPEEQPRRDEVQQVMESITRKALERSHEDAEDVLSGHQDIVRERRLRLGSTARNGRGGIQVLDTDTRSRSLASRSLPAAKRTTPEFASVAAEYFIMPLINHMWLYLRDSTSRLRDGAGTRILLDAMVQTQFLGTLTVLVHASRHAPAFIAIIAPAAMELAITLCSRSLDRNVKPEHNNAVLTAGLEVALIVLDASADIDGGRTLGLEHTVLLKAVGAWAGEVLEKAGEREEKVSAAAAGVVVRVEKVEERWGRSMVGF